MGDPNLVGDLRGRLIVFDLDGTLVDSRRDLADSANALIRELGGHPLTEEAIGAMVGEGAAVLVRRALAAAGVTESAGALARFLELYDARLLDHTAPYEGIEDALNHAHRRARVAVLTNKPTRATERILDGVRLRSLVDDVIGGDGPHPRKPDPAALIELMTRAGATRDSTLLVGDSLIDHETARRAGVRCCLAKYGFGFQTFPTERLSEADCTVGRATDLVSVIDRFTVA